MRVSFRGSANSVQFPDVTLEETAPQKKQKFFILISLTNKPVFLAQVTLKQYVCYCQDYA